MKRDPYNNEKRWQVWKEKHFDNCPRGINKNDWNLLIQFLKDMELGLNVPKDKKGKREAGTLLNLSSHNQLFLKNFKKPLVKITKNDLHKLEKEIQEGKIKKSNGKPYTAFGNYVKDFKVFWNYLIRTEKVKENIIEDITSKVDKPAWVYLTEPQIKKFFNKLSLDYRTLCWFMLDSGMRVTEANSIQIKHFSDEFKQVTIPEEASKTFERTINLKLCSEFIKEYVKENNLKSEDYLFQKKPFTINKYLRYHCGKLFGDKISNPKSKGNYKNFTMYDIRHCSACYWYNRYPTHKGLMYRFGWRKADKIEYYSHFLGVADEIRDDDMILGEDKNKIYKLEKQIEEQDKKLENIYEKYEQLIEELYKRDLQSKKEIEELEELTPK